MKHQGFKRLMAMALSASMLLSMFVAPTSAEDTTVTYGEIDKSAFVGDSDANRSDQPPSYALDGDTSTKWHTAANVECPHWYTVDMQEVTTITHIDVMGRVSVSGEQLNGYPCVIDVYISEDGEDWGESIKSVDWSSQSITSGMTNTIEFDSAITTRYIKLDITETLLATDTYGAACVAEFYFYNVNPMEDLNALIATAEALLPQIADADAEVALQAEIDAAYAFVAAGDATDVAEMQASLSAAISTARKTMVTSDVLYSPDSSIVVDIEIDEDGTFLYTMTRNGTVLIEPSSLGYIFYDADGGNMNDDFALLSTEYSSVDTTWEPGHNMIMDEIPDVYNQAIYYLMDSAGRKLNITFRVYDEGIGFYYEFPEDNAAVLEDGFTIYREDSQFTIPGGTSAHYYALKSQAIPSTANIENISNQQSYAPLTLEYADGTCAGLFESNLYDYARLKIYINDSVVTSNTRWGVTSGEGSADIVADGTPFTSPWRGFIVSDEIGELQVSSYMLQNLADESIDGLYELEDTSWIEGGTLIREAKLTEENTMDCIEFAAENDISYILYDSGWYGTEDDPDMSPMEPKVGTFLYLSTGTTYRTCAVDVRDAAEWAAEEDVGVVLYVNHLHMENYDLDEVFSTYQEWGIAGVKFGFVNVGNQYWSKWLAEAVATAAKYELVVIIHDEYIPTGLNRAYPNLLNVEGILGDEGNPDLVGELQHAFTRTYLGSTDHTYCYPVADYRDPAKKTNTFNLASPIIFYGGSASLFWYGKPSDYENGANPEIKFWADMPGEWNESIYIDSSYGEYYTMARRSEDEWFLGSLSAIDRNLNFSPDFLEEDTKYLVELYTDALGSTFDDSVVNIAEYIVDADTDFQLSVMEGGGVAMRFVPATDEEIATIPAYSVSTEQLTYAYYEAQELNLNLYTTKSVEESQYDELMEQAAAALADESTSEDEKQRIADELFAITDSFILCSTLYDLVPQSEMTATASSDRPGVQAVEMAIDGDPTTFWQTTAGIDVPHTLTVDLGTERLVSALDLTARDDHSGPNGYPEVFDIQVSDDGINFETIQSVDWSSKTIVMANTYTVTLDAPVTTRYIQLYITDAKLTGTSSYLPASLAEFNVYASPYAELDQKIAEAEELLYLAVTPSTATAMADAIDAARDFIETSSVTDMETMQAHVDALDSYISLVVLTTSVSVQVESYDYAAGTSTFNLVIDSAENLKALYFTLEGATYADITPADGFDAWELEEGRMMLGYSKGQSDVLSGTDILVATITVAGTQGAEIAISDVISANTEKETEAAVSVATVSTVDAFALALAIQTKVALIEDAQLGYQEADYLTIQWTALEDIFAAAIEEVVAMTDIALVESFAVSDVTDAADLIPTILDLYDLNDDNVISFADITSIVPYFGYSLGEEGYDAKYDVNPTDSIGSDDYLVLYQYIASQSADRA